VTVGAFRRSAEASGHVPESVADGTAATASMQRAMREVRTRQG
jgi:hypothetical protein